MFWWILLAVASSAVFVITVSFILPKFLLQNKYKLKKLQDRGIGKFRTASDDRAMLYEPSISARKYVKQYLLTDKGGEKTLICKISPDIAYLEYDVVLFNGNHTVFRVINVRDVIEERGFTKEIELPAETSYVSLVLNAANDEKLDKSVNVKVSPLKVLAFVGITMALSVGVAFCLKLSCSNLFGGVFRESFMNDANGNLFTAALALGLCAVGIITVTVILAIRNIFISKVRRKK